MFAITNNKDATKYLSDRQELAISKSIDGRRTPMSGAAVFFKGDVVKRAADGVEWLIEAKTQMQAKQSFSIKEEWVKKAKEEAFATHKDTFAIAFNFGGEENIENNYYIITEKDFKRLVGEED